MKLARFRANFMQGSIFRAATASHPYDASHGSRQPNAKHTRGGSHTKSSYGSNRSLSMPSRTQQLEELLNIGCRRLTAQRLLVLVGLWSSDPANRVFSTINALVRDNSDRIPEVCIALRHRFPVALQVRCLRSWHLVETRYARGPKPSFHDPTALAQNVLSAELARACESG